MDGFGAGLAVLAFWGFLASVVVGGIWYGLRERQAQFATLRSLADSGKPIDEAVVDKVLGNNKRVDRDLKIAGLITLSVAPGLAVLSWFVSQVSPQALYPILGAAGLVACIGAGLLIAARSAERSLKEDGASSANRNMVI